ncbi:hypothetical protein H1X88_22820 [Vibrio parahaemolyticus]|uniref:hypothetical protein n=1 Tax=Vibrio parahaemolyticus TaxID=670 RepID=UPI00165545D6|nr:hypothetical protein [Vibrio parahaemolyticus]MBC8659587.1 hypothetical protein [Vibrio parahaemolyticus]
MIDALTLSASGILAGFINVICVFWLKERLKKSITHEYSMKLEKFKKDIQSELQREQQVYNLGAMSHMATTVFDKHAEFSEKYIEKVMECFYFLRSSQESEKAIGYAGDLTKLRFQYAAWLTCDIDEQLLTFENKLRKIGTNSELMKTPKNTGTNQEFRDEKARELGDLLTAFTAWNENIPEHREVQLDYIQNAIRDVLGVNKLVYLRELIVENSEKQLRASK